MQVPVIALSQFNRGPEQRQDKRPMLSDLRESGALEQDSDLVILVHRPEVYEDDSPRAGEADLILAKHRGGPTTTITVARQLHYSRSPTSPNRDVDQRLAGLQLERGPRARLPPRGAGLPRTARPHPGSSAQFFIRSLNWFVRLFGSSSALSRSARSSVRRSGRSGAW